MRANLSLGPTLALAACVLFAAPARGQVEGCPEDRCVESETSIVFNSQTNQMDAFATATTDYTTSYWYDLCVGLGVGRLNGPYFVNATNLIAGNPWCLPAQTTMERSGSVAAAPGRQYFAVGSAQLRAYFEYWIVVPTCGQYCAGYWYDAMGYSQLISTQPSSAEWPSIVYTYPIVFLPVPIVYQEIAMSGSLDTAWSPPVIYSVSPSVWPAGGQTTFTISGDGFGYDPDVTISGSGVGVNSYTPKCNVAPSASCNTQIEVTVMVDASTPGESIETITVTAGGLNLSGYLPVEIAGQSGQATAQAVTLALIANKPYIVLGSGGGACVGSDITGSPRSVQVGQQIAFTACLRLPTGTSLSSVSSMTWTPTAPDGKAVGGYTTVNAGATSSGTVVPLSSPSCLAGQSYCSFPAFYWVDQANGRQFKFKYTLTNGDSNEATVTFNVGGPSAVAVTATQSPTGVSITKPPYADPRVPVLPLLILGGTGQPGMKFSATAANLASGRFQWVQLIDRDSSPYLNSTGQHNDERVPVGTKYVDHAFPYGFHADGTRVGTVTSTTVLDDTAVDSPWTPLIEFYGEMARIFSATMYLMWVPSAEPSCANGAACTIPVPQGNVSWSWRGDAINTLEPQSNGGVGFKRWVLNPSNCSSGTQQNYQSATDFPVWNGAINP